MSTSTQIGSGGIKRFYESLAEKVPSSSFIFLNYGFAESNRRQYSWIRRVDLPHKFHLNLVKHVLAETDLAGKIVLEIGSGRGGNCYYLSRYTKCNAIYGCDNCESHIKFCQMVHKLSNVNFLQADAQQLPFGNETFDVILSVESSHCYPDFKNFLAEVYRVLKLQGVFCYADLWFVPILRLDWSQRKSALDASRFNMISEEDISEQVFAALKSSDCLKKILLPMINRENKPLLDGVVKIAEAVKLSLALGQCSYKVWRLGKP